MRTTVVSIVVVLMFVSLAFFPTQSVMSQAPAPAQVKGITDYAQVNASDGLNNFLVIRFNLTVLKAGHYRVTGSLISPVSQTFITTNSTYQLLGLGDQSILVKFESIPIYNNPEDGNFGVQYIIENDTGTNQWFYEGNYTTQNIYSHISFDSPNNYPSTPVNYEPTIIKDSSLGRYVIRNKVMTVWVYYKDKTPRIVWFYTMDNKSRTQYVCEFEGVHGFIKGAVGRFQPSNSKYDGSFTEGTLASTTSATGRSKIFGDYVSVTIVISDVPIREASSTNPQALANVTLTLMLAAGDRSIKYQNELVKSYSISGGTQLGLNFEAELRPSLGVNGLALQETIWSETNKSYYHDFSFQDASSTVIPRESTDSSDYEYFPTKDPQAINFISKNTQEHKAEGYFYWVNRAQIDGTSSQDVVTYQYEPKDHKLVLYIGFITTKNSINTVKTETIGIGVHEDGNPSLQKYIKPKPAEQPSILITIFGWVTAVILVILPLYVDFRRSQKRMKELEEEFGEEL